MKKLSFKKIGEKVSGLWDKDRTKVRVNPQREWDILTGVFGILLAGLLALNIWLFSLIEQEKIFFTQVLEDVSVVSIDLEKYKETLDFFDTKKEAFDDLVDSKPFVVDPSL